MTGAIAVLRAHDVSSNEAAIAACSIMPYGDIQQRVPSSPRVPDGEVWVIDDKPTPAAKFSNISVVQDSVCMDTVLREPMRQLSVHWRKEK